MSINTSGFIELLEQKMRKIDWLAPLESNTDKPTERQKALQRVFDDLLTLADHDFMKADELWNKHVPANIKKPT